MEEKDLRDLETIFHQVEDPRLERTKRHRLRDIIIIAICGVICGAEGWVEIEEFGKAKEAWFTDLLDLPNGIPSHDTDGAGVRAQGMHIGSGIAEAACKTVVSTRAKRSGMRWTPAGLDAILALRTAVLNHEFDQRWQRFSQEAA